MNDLIDIVYPLGSGSRWSNNEIRYSLRSVETYAKGWRNIYIVGVMPAWLSGIKYIPATDPLEFNADGNIAMKILKACEDPELSNPFLFINDDHIFVSDCDIREFPFYHKGDLQNKSPQYFQGGMYVQRLRRTMNILKKRGLPTKHFDCHTPILIDKEKFPGIIESFPFREDIGFTMKSLYANSMLLHGNYRRDLNIKAPCTEDQISEMIEGEMVMAFNNFGLSGALKKFLKERFNQYSNFEIMEKNQQILFTEAENWLNNPDPNYQEGVRLYTELGKDLHLKGLLKRSAAERMMTTLQKHLKAIHAKMEKQGMKPMSEKELTSKKAPSKVAGGQKQAAKSGKKTGKKGKKPIIDANPYVNIEDLPASLQERYRRNQEIMPILGSLHEKMKAVDLGEDHDDQRKDLAQEIAHLEEERDGNFQAIDQWWQTKNDKEQPKKPSGRLNKEQIEKIEDEGIKALSKEMRIDANKNYLKRYKDSDKPKQIVEVKLRTAELEEWGVEL